jgi:hypothetical protein
MDKIVLVVARKAYCSPTANVCASVGQNCPAFPRDRTRGIYSGSRRNRQLEHTLPSENVDDIGDHRAKLLFAATLKALGMDFAGRDGDLVKCVLTDPLLSSPAREILDYLSRRPEAQDTIDGILHWWVLDSCIRSWEPKIAQTVAQLVERGYLEEKPSSDGKIFYRVNPLYLSALR